MNSVLVLLLLLLFFLLLLLFSFQVAVIHQHRPHPPSLTPFSSSLPPYSPSSRSPFLHVLFFSPFSFSLFSFQGLVPILFNSISLASVPYCLVHNFTLTSFFLRIFSVRNNNVQELMLLDELYSLIHLPSFFFITLLHFPPSSLYYTSTYQCFLHPSTPHTPSFLLYHLSIVLLVLTASYTSLQHPYSTSIPLLSPPASTLETVHHYTSL